MKKRILSAIAVLLIFAACKKEEEKSTWDKIQGKWNLSSINFKESYLGTVYYDTLFGTPADYFDFRGDSKVYLYIDGDRDTSAYSILNDSKLVLDNSDTLNINTLTENILTLYRKDVYTGGYDELTVNLKK